MPVSPEPFIDQKLRVLGIVLHYQREYRMTDLSVAGFVGLDAGDHFFRIDSRPPHAPATRDPQTEGW